MPPHDEPGHRCWSDPTEVTREECGDGAYELFCGCGRLIGFEYPDD